MDQNELYSNTNINEDDQLELQFESDGGRGNRQDGFRPSKRTLIIGGAALAAVILAIVFLCFAGPRTALKKLFMSDEGFYRSCEKTTAGDLSELYRAVYPILSDDGRYIEIFPEKGVDTIYDSIEEQMSLSARTGRVGDAFGADSEILFNGDTILAFQYIYDSESDLAYLKVPDVSEDFMAFSAEKPLMAVTGEYLLPDEFSSKLEGFLDSYLDSIGEDSLLVEKSSSKIYGQRYETYSTELDGSALSELFAFFGDADTVRMDTYIGSHGYILGRRLTWSDGDMPRMLRFTMEKNDGRDGYRFELSDDEGNVNVYFVCFERSGGAYSGVIESLGGDEYRLIAEGFSVGDDGIFGGRIVLLKDGETKTMTLSSDSGRQAVKVLSTDGRSYTRYSSEATGFGFSVPDSFTLMDGSAEDYISTMVGLIIESMGYEPPEDNEDEPPADDEPDPVIPSETVTTTAPPQTTPATTTQPPQSQTTTQATTTVTTTADTTVTTTTARRDEIDSQSGIYAYIGNKKLTFPLDVEDLGMDSVNYKQYSVPAGRTVGVDLGNGVTIYLRNPYVQEVSAESALVVGIEAGEYSSAIGDFTVNGYSVGDFFPYSEIFIGGGVTSSDGVEYKAYKWGNVTATFGIKDRRLVSVKYLDESEYEGYEQVPEGKDLSSVGVYFDGGSVKLPISAGSYRDEFNLDNERLSGGSDNIFYNDDYTAYVRVENDTYSEEYAYRCIVTELYTESGSDVSFTLNGISVGSLESELQSAFGEPTYSSISTRTVYGYIDEYNGIEITIRVSDGRVSSMTYRVY